MSEVIPPFPQDTDHDPVDWSAVDWNRKITLPEDERDYLKSVQEFTVRREFQALASPIQLKLKI